MAIHEGICNWAAADGDGLNMSPVLSNLAAPRPPCPSPGHELLKQLGDRFEAGFRHHNVRGSGVRLGPESWLASRSRCGICRWMSRGEIFHLGDLRGTVSAVW